MFKMMLIRHGETELNKIGVLQGHYDEPLNSTGKLQANKLGKSFSKEVFTHIFSSDLLRAKQTCSLSLAENRSYVGSNMTDGIKTDPILREQNYGCMEGKPKSELIQAARKAGLPVRDFVAEGGESSTHLCKRVKTFFRSLCEELRSIMQNDNMYDAKPINVMIVTHNGFLRAYFEMLQDDFGCEFNGKNFNKGVSNASKTTFLVKFPTYDDGIVFGETDEKKQDWLKGMTVRCTGYDK